METISTEDFKVSTMKEVCEELMNDIRTRYKSFPIVFGKWKLLESGDLDFEDGAYIIYQADLEIDNMLIHMSMKSFIEWNDFMPAYLSALRYAGIEKIEKMY